MVANFVVEKTDVTGELNPADHIHIYFTRVV